MSNEIKVTDFVKDGRTCLFSFYRAGFVYYKVHRPGTTEWYLFPIDLDDVGNGTLENEEKCIRLMRWIRLSIEQGTIQLINND